MDSSASGTGGSAESSGAAAKSTGGSGGTQSGDPAGRSGSTAGIANASGGGDSGAATGGRGESGGRAGGGESGRASGGRAGGGGNPSGGSPSGGSAAGMAEGGVSPGGKAGAAGQGSAGQATSTDVASACPTPLVGALLLDPTLGWKTAALRIGVAGPSCVLQSGAGIGSADNALYFALEPGGSYSMWTALPWEYTVEAGQKSNDLPQNQSITVFPSLGAVHLRVVYTLSGESVTVSSVAAQ